MEGNLGRGVMKVSAVALEHQIVEAPAMVFQDQQDLADAFKAGLLEKDFVAVMRFQGPRSNGMPELHKMTPFLGVLAGPWLQSRAGDGRAYVRRVGENPGGDSRQPRSLERWRFWRGCRMAISSASMASTGTLELKVDAEEFAARTPAKGLLGNNMGGRSRAVWFHAHGLQLRRAGRQRLYLCLGDA